MGGGDAVERRRKAQSLLLRQRERRHEAAGSWQSELRFRRPPSAPQAANQLSNKLSHAQHLDEVTWTTKNWHGLQMQRLSVVLHTAVAWQTVNELACGESGIVHGAECESL